MPAANVLEQPNYFKIFLGVPGISKEDLHVLIENNKIIISADADELSEEDEEDFTRKEYNYRSFIRTFIPPYSINPENVEAKYENGVLEILIPKNELKITSRRREIDIV
jgi:HSP20 family protein